MRSGMVSVVGRPNVGKSSLVNALVGQKVSIVTRKPQTTRHRIQGVVHRDAGQIVLVDTPGLHAKTTRALNRYLNDTAAAALRDVDLILFVVEAGKWNDEDDAVLARLVKYQTPVGLVINKVDRVADKKKLLPEIEALAGKREWAFILPVSAMKKDNLAALEQEVFARLPEGPALYPQDQVVGADLSFQVSEIIREKLMERLRQELPYVLTVQVDKLEDERGTMMRIEATIVVERENQKAIVVGAGGATLKAVGSAARRDLEKLLGKKVFLKLWARADKDWTDDPAALKRFGYEAP